MASSLRDNLNSAYLHAANRLNSKRARKKIVAYVESYDDVAFWRSLLGEFEGDDLYFEVMLPSATSLSKGKKMVLMNTLDSDAFGDSLIACVDSDYDYLLQGRTSTSRNLNNNPYIFQTYAYAIENHLCFADSLHQVCVEATLNDRMVIDFKAFMTEYSRRVYQLFLWNIWFYRNKDTNSFPMGDFNSCVIVRHFNVANPMAALDNVKKSADRKRRELERRFPGKAADVRAMGEELTRLGLRPETTYLYMQGHHVMDNVVLKLLHPVCTMLRREREDEIKRLAQHSMQYENELAGYRNSQVEVDKIIRRNYGYKSLFLYRRLRDDVKRFVDSIRKEHT